jgi:spore coat polysaccharide biosynthesis predicted glycosyltransferase SpsG
MIPYDSTNKEFGDIVNATLNISEEEYTRIVQNNYALLDQFSYLEVAKRFVELGQGDDSNIEIKAPNKRNSADWKKLSKNCYKILHEDTPKGFRLSLDVLKELEKEDYIRMPK